MPRRAVPVFPVRPNKSTTTVSAVASPGRAVRPYKTRYYCNTGRLIESFPRRRFLRRRRRIICVRTVTSKGRDAPDLPRTDYPFLLPPFLYFSFFPPRSRSPLARPLFTGESNPER